MNRNRGYRSKLSADYTDFGLGRSRARAQKGPTSNSAPVGLELRRNEINPFKAPHIGNIPFGNGTPSSETHRPPDTRMRPDIAYRRHPPQTEICVICGYFYFFAIFALFCVY